MSDPQVAMWLVIMGVADAFAVAIALFLVFPSEKRPLHWVQKLGFSFMIAGLIVQLVRSSHYIAHGAYPVDVLFPMWITKDVGACILVYFYAFISPTLKG
jgi:hypothetical protein